MTSFADSGGGGTNLRGHKVALKYQFAKNWQCAASLFLNTLQAEGDVAVRRILAMEPGETTTIGSYDVELASVSKELAVQDAGISRDRDLSPSRNPHRRGRT